jgi:hypothetical protein
MKIKAVFLSLLLAIFFAAPSFALIKIDNESVDLAIDYAIKVKGNSSDDILGKNWLNDGTGRILNIYTPFIQIVMRAQDFSLSGDTPEDVKNIKKLMAKKITSIKKQDNIRFIVSVYGDKDDFAQKYTAYIVDENQIVTKGKKKEPLKLMPIKAEVDKIAERDAFNPLHPYSAVNSYNFNFAAINKLKTYYFVVSDGKEEVVRFLINNNDIF